MKNIKEIINFLSENNISLASTGCYNFPEDVAVKAIEEFCETGKSDLIKKHQKWTWGCWELDKDRIYCGLSLEEAIELKELKSFWGDNNDLNVLENLISDLINREEILVSYRHKRKAGFTKKLKDECLKRDNYKCVKCKSTEHLEVDHIKELIDGGDNEINNLQTLCRSCHRKKTNKSIIKRKK